MQSVDLVTSIAVTVGMVGRKYGISPFRACTDCLQDGNLVGPASCQQHVLSLTPCWSRTSWTSQLCSAAEVAAAAECQLLNWLACVDVMPACTLHAMEGYGFEHRMACCGDAIHGECGNQQNVCPASGVAEGPET